MSKFSRRPCELPLRTYFLHTTLPPVHYVSTIGNTRSRLSVDVIGERPPMDLEKMRVSRELRYCRPTDHTHANYTQSPAGARRALQMITVIRSRTLRTIGALSQTWLPGTSSARLGLIGGAM